MSHGFLGANKWKTCQCKKSQPSLFILDKQKWSQNFSSWQGFWYFAEKKAKFCGIFRGKFAEKSADFAGFSREKSQNSRKIGRFHRIFAGKKSKFAENRPISQDFRGRKVKIRGKSADFAGFSREKSQDSQKNRLISRDFSGKKSNYEGFSWSNSKKNRLISREISGGNFAKKQSVKNSRFGWSFFLANLANFLANLFKIDQFCIDMTSGF